MDAPALANWGGTFSGNPLACEAALAVLEIIEKEISVRAPIYSVSVSASARRSGRHSGNWSAMFEEWAPCRGWNWCARRRRGNLPTKKQSKYHSIATSTAW